MQNEIATGQQRLVLDRDVQAVLEFMERHIEARKLLSVAERVPDVARLLWAQYPQEPLVPVSWSGQLGL